MGATDARAILARSVRVAALDHPALAKINLAVGARETLVERIELALRDEPPAELLASASALYATMRMLLETLVGEPLAAKLLRDANLGDAPR